MINIKKLSMVSSAIRNILHSNLLNTQRPIQVSLAVTNRCNLKCIYCYGSYGYRKEQDFTTDELKALFRYLKRIGTFQIFLTGGEPLLRKDIAEIVSYLKSLEFNMGMVTNGLLIPSNIGILKKLNHIIISLDGDKSANDANRGKGTYSGIMKSVELLRQNNIKFSFKAVFNKNNMCQLDYLLSVAEKYGTTLETIMPYENTDDKSQFLSKEQKKALLDKILAYVKQKRPIEFSYLAHKMSNEVYFKYGENIVFGKKSGSYPPCIAGQLYLFIDANGDVYPCNQLMGRFKPKNIRKDGLRNAIRYARNRPCNLCSTPFLNEKRYLFSLNPKTVLYRLLQ